MFTNYIILSILGLGIITSIILQWKLHHSVSKLPDDWKKRRSIRNFRLGIFFLSLFITGGFLTESISEYLAKKSIYNSFVFSIDFTVTTLFIFGFLFIHTQTYWKRCCYFLFYLIILIYLIQGGYYDRSCVLPANSSLLIFSLYFLAGLLHLTDLLLNPKSDYFNFRLKINISLIIYSLISIIITSFYWAESMTIDNNPSVYLYYLNSLINELFYLSLTIVFIQEIFKLGRKSVKE